VGPRADLDRRKISSQPGFDPGPPSQESVALPTELPGTRLLETNEKFLSVEFVTQLDKIWSLRERNETRNSFL